ncbi:uncharacterized protein VTP21DRAFT_9987 [Calcarisporiella thermophila]|uniref:uncharacterized protein n=1 Tax=Calcarisporiella thermophila TaxID=911321 RepID=UPI00374330C2
MKRIASDSVESEEIVMKRQCREDTEDVENVSPAKRITRSMVSKGCKLSENTLKQTFRVNKASKTAKNKPTQISTPKLSPHARARMRLRTTANTLRLVGRETERAKVRGFFAEHALGHKPGALYISGSPGSGKSALLLEITNEMGNDFRKRKVKVVKLNCMAVSDPKTIYSKLLREARGTDGDCGDLEKLVRSTRANSMYVFILDEIDQLLTKDQDVLYKLFEWASMPDSRLVLIGIANALDMTDRFLPRLRAKNCEPQLLNFNPYDPSEIVSIIEERLRDDEDEKTDHGSPLLIEHAAIQLCARKVAASTGDVRKALELCRQALEMIEGESRRTLGDMNGSRSPASTGRVTIAHMNRVLTMALGSPIVQMMRALDVRQKLTLAAALLMSKERKPDMTLGRLQTVYRQLCSGGDTGVGMRGMSLTPVELQDVVSMLEVQGLLTLSKAREERARKITLAVPEVEVVQVVSEVGPLERVMREALARVGQK